MSNFDKYNLLKPSIIWMVLGVVGQHFYEESNYALLGIAIGGLHAFILIARQIIELVRLVVNRCNNAFMRGLDCTDSNPHLICDLIYTSKSPFTKIVKFFFILGNKERNR